MDHRTKTLLIVDASINLALGILLLAFPAGLPGLLGLPIPTTFFYTSILGAVLFGIGLALLIERFSSMDSITGLGLAGAIIINLCGGSALLLWLLINRSGPSGIGGLLLWAIALLVIGTGVVELFQVTQNKT